MYYIILDLGVLVNTGSLTSISSCKTIIIGFLRCKRQVIWDKLYEKKGIEQNWVLNAPSKIGFQIWKMILLTWGSIQVALSLSALYNSPWKAKLGVTWLQWMKILSMRVVQEDFWIHTSILCIANKEKRGMQMNENLQPQGFIVLGISNSLTCLNNYEVMNKQKMLGCICSSLIQTHSFLSWEMKLCLFLICN